MKGFIGCLLFQFAVAAILFAAFYLGTRMAEPTVHQAQHTSPATMNAEYVRQERARLKREAEERIPQLTAKAIAEIEHRIMIHANDADASIAEYIADERMRSAVADEFAARGFAVKVKGERVEINWE